MPDWLTPASAPVIAAAISAVVALIVGVIVAVFAWLQWRTARAKFRLDLYDRRVKLFSSLTKFLTEPLGGSPKALDDLQVILHEAGFLFGLEVQTTLGAIAEDVAKFQKSHVRLTLAEDWKKRIADKWKPQLMKVMFPYIYFGNWR